MAKMASNVAKLTVRQFRNMLISREFCNYVLLFLGLWISTIVIVLVSTFPLTKLAYIVHAHGEITYEQ